MSVRIQIVAIVATALLLLGVLELVRRRRLLERYALLWLLSALVLMALAVWRGLLEQVAAAVGIAYPPSALFVIAFGFILVLLLHFSIAVSRLSDQSKVLAQRVALLEERERRTGAAAELGAGGVGGTAGAPELGAGSTELGARQAAVAEPAWERAGRT